MKKLAILLVLIFSSASQAETSFDRLLIENGVIDKQYNVINEPLLAEAFRITTNRMAEMLPLKVDNVTTATNVLLTRFGLFYTYRIDGIETRSDVENILISNGYDVEYKNYLCSLEFSKSEFFKKIKNYSTNITILNSKSQVIYTLRIPISSC